MKSKKIAAWPTTLKLTVHEVDGVVSPLFAAGLFFASKVTGLVTWTLIQATNKGSQPVISEKVARHLYTLESGDVVAIRGRAPLPALFQNLQKVTSCEPRNSQGSNRVCCKARRETIFCPKMAQDRAIIWP